MGLTTNPPWLLHVFLADAKIEELREKHWSGKNRKSQLCKTLNPPSMQTTKRLDKLSICWHWLQIWKRNRALKYIWNETRILFHWFFSFPFFSYILKELLGRSSKLFSYSSLNRSAESYETAAVGTGVWALVKAGETEAHREKWFTWAHEATSCHTETLVSQSSRILWKACGPSLQIWVNAMLSWAHDFTSLRFSVFSKIGTLTQICLLQVRF